MTFRKIYEFDSNYETDKKYFKNNNIPRFLANSLSIKTLEYFSPQTHTLKTLLNKKKHISRRLAK